MAVIEVEEVVVDVEIPTKPPYPILLEMAELIRRRGWCQGKYEDEETGQVCIMGAFYQMLADADTWLEDDCYEAPYYIAMQAFERSIAQDFEAFEGEHLDAAFWNDLPGRTKFEVVDRLRRVGWLGK